MDVVKWLSQFLFLIVQGIFYILYYVEVAFYWLAGAGNPLDVKVGDGQADAWMDSNIIIQLLTEPKQEGEPNAIQQIFPIFLLLGLCIFAVSLIIAIVKSTMVDDPGAGKKVFRRSLEALLMFIGISVGFIFFISAVSSLMNVLVNAVSTALGSGGNQTSMANTLFYSCFSGVKNPDQVFGESIKLITVDGGMMSYEQINNVISLKFTDGNFNYIIALLVGCVILWAMFVCVLGLVERIINLILLYIIGPVTVGTTPMDEGERFKAWRGLVLAKSLGAFGNILSVYIYLYFIDYYGTFVSPDSHMALKIIYYIIAIGGAFTASKGANLIASIVSREAGVQDGWSQSQTNGLLQGGMSMAKGVLGGAMIGAGSMISAGANGLGNGTTAFSSPVASNGEAPTQKGIKRALNQVTSGAKKVGSAVGTGFSYGRFQGAMSGATQGLIGGAVALGGVVLGGAVKGIGAGVKAIAGGIKNKVTGGPSASRDKLSDKNAKKELATKFTADRQKSNEDARKQRLAEVSKPLDNFRENKANRDIEASKPIENIKEMKRDVRLANINPEETKKFKEKYGFVPTDKVAQKQYIEKQRQDHASKVLENKGANKEEKSTPEFKNAKKSISAINKYFDQKNKDDKWSLKHGSAKYEIGKKPVVEPTKEKAPEVEKVTEEPKGGKFEKPVEDTSKKIPEVKKPEGLKPEETPKEEKKGDAE